MSFEYYRSQEIPRPSASWLQEAMKEYVYLFILFYKYSVLMKLNILIKVHYLITDCGKSNFSSTLR